MEGEGFPTKGVLMRLLTALFVALLAFSHASAEELFMSTGTEKLVRWTPKQWSEREKHFALPGSYKQCGNYLFLFAPAHASNPTPMFGFGVADAKGGIASVIALDSRGGRVRIWEGADGAPPSVKVFKNDPNDASVGYLILLPKKEYALVYQCLGVKKSPKRTTT